MGASEDIKRGIEETVLKLSTSIADNVLNELIAANPKDTNHSSNNWIVSLGKPTSVIDGSKKNPSNAVQTASREYLRTYKLSDGSIFITNNVHYLIWLVLGHSNQAPPGWDRFAVELGIQKGAKKIGDNGL